jgi:hypothetical protein
MQKQIRNSLAGIVGILGVLLTSCSDGGNPEGALYARVVEGNVFETVPVRGDFEPLRNRRTGFEYKCSECHTSIDSAPRSESDGGEHAAIYAAYEHGENTTCVNCHHTEDRNAYVAHDGTIISAENPAQLCGKCHVSTYREWKAGIHGRQNGYWDTSRGPQTKLMCVQCHDPHRPKFTLMTPDPPPIRSRLKLDVTTEGH